MFTKEDILKQLETFSVAKGHLVTMHTSLRAVGPVEGGADTLLDALIEFFTPGGGLFCVPTHTWHTRVYDMRTDDTCIGTFPRVAAGRPDGVRSAHPTHSMKAFGDKALAEEFVKGDELVETMTDPRGCYGELYRQDGYVLLTGVGHNRNTYLHVVEDMLGLTRRLVEEKTKYTLIYPNGEEKERWIRWLDFSKTGDVSTHFPKFEPAFRYHGAIVDGMIGNADVQLCSARKMKEVVELIYTRAGDVELMADDVPLDESLYK